MVKPGGGSVKYCVDSYLPLDRCQPQTGYWISTPLILHKFH